jgi:hypothetical protein
MVEKSEAYRGFKLVWLDPPPTGERWIVNVASNDRRLATKLGSSAAVFTGGTLIMAIAAAKQAIDAPLGL